LIVLYLLEFFYSSGLSIYAYKLFTNASKTQVYLLITKVWCFDCFVSLQADWVFTTYAVAFPKISLLFSALFWLNRWRFKTAIVYKLGCGCIILHYYGFKSCYSWYLHTSGLAENALCYSDNWATEAYASLNRDFLLWDW
jgi:hypothetical protein